MPDLTRERRNAARYPLVLAADVVDVTKGGRLCARTSDVSQTGCYIDTLSPLPQGSQARLRMSHHEQVFEVACRVMYVSPGLGMGVRFEDVAPEQQAVLDRWLGLSDREL
jgi:PilZ domain